MTVVLLERQDELGHVRAVLRRAKEGSGSQVVIAGPLGNGKSALLQALADVDEADGMRVLRASGSFLERDFAFGVVRQLLDPVLSSAAPDDRERWLAGAAGLARIVFADDSPPSARPSAVLRSEAATHGLTAVLRTLSVERPVLVLVDDLQWVDEPSLRWLTRLAKLLDTLRVVVVVTVREGDRRADTPLVTAMTAVAARCLRPAPFSYAATEEFIRHHTGQAPDEAFTEACHDTTDGNPMFLTSVLHSSAYAGIPPLAAHVEVVRALRPAQLRERLTQCLRTQSDSVRAFAKSAVVLGEHADVELIGRLAGLDAIGCGVAMRALHQLGMLPDEEVPRFAHIVMQDAVEQSMTVEEREVLHLGAVKLLHAGGHSAEQVAAQLMAITTQHDWWAIEVLRSGADTAMRRGAPEVAVRYLRRALQGAAPDGEWRASLLVELAMAERGLDRAASVRHISNAVPLLRSVRERAAAVVRIAPTVLVAAPEPVHDLIASVAAELGAASELTGVDRELAYRLEARVRFSCHADPAGLGDSIRRLTQLAPDGMVGTGAGRELLIVLLDAVTLALGAQSAEVARLAKLVLEREPASPTHVHTAIPLLVTALSAADAGESLVPWLDLALERALLQNVTIERALIRSEQAFVLVHLGQVDEARNAAVDALDLAALDWKGSNATAAVGIAAVAMELGDPQLISQLLGLYHERTESTGVTPVYRLLHASEAAVSGDHATALEYVLECGYALDRMGWSNPVLFPWRSSAALLNGRLGKLDLALDFAEESRRRAVEWGAPSGIGRALRILGHLTPEQRGVDLLRESVEVLGHSGNGFQLAKSLVGLGSRLLVDGDPSAPVHLRRARDLALRLGAWRLVTKVDLALQASPRGDLAPPVPPTLTKSERRVAELVVAGHANQEIADILNVTCRTVEKHLTNSFRKLGIRGRTELSEVLVRVYPAVGE